MASRESSLLFSLERGPGTALQAMQEKKALSSRGRGRLRGSLELRRPWGFSHEAQRGSQGASCAAPGKSGLHDRGEGERFIALESWEGTRASRRIEEGLLRSFSGCSGKPSFPSTSAGDLRERPGASERRGLLWGWRGLSGLRWAWHNGRGPHLEGRQEPQASSPFRTLTAGSLQSWDRRVRPRLV